ncbi:hypothetical protein GO730_22330 [Spirosoma sp. HMF3257]|uniref:Uncharacterized protein n=1 Tax=Spirosoma telluris TaxID=2183553 RepID=A0A327NTX9_9BACT|nr:hypothetical protein [Spirosoma telluris]RAI76218.1 hypothetical protein HMF3257_22275 [Spirosoma telluris]
MEKVVDYSLEWDVNPNRPDSWRIIITTSKHNTPFRLPINSPEEFLAAAHMLSKSSVLYDLTTGFLVVPQRPAGT